MFKPGDYIHHATGGLCRVEEITSLDISGADKNRLYYKLAPLDRRKSTIYTPVDNTKVAMRKALTAQEVEALIDEFPRIDGMNIGEEKKREQMYKEALTSSDAREWVGMIKTLYRRRQERTAQGKKITATEDRYYQAVLDRLNSEIALAMNIDKSEVEGYVVERLKNVQEHQSA